MFFFFFVGFTVETTCRLRRRLSCSQALLNLGLRLSQLFNLHLSFGLDFFFFWRLPSFLSVFDLLLSWFDFLAVLIFFLLASFVDKLFHCWYITMKSYISNLPYIYHKNELWFKFNDSAAATNSEIISSHFFIIPIKFNFSCWFRDELFMIWAFNFWSSLERSLLFS